MEEVRKNEFVSTPGLAIGLFLFSLAAIVPPVFLREGLVTFLIARSDLRGAARYDQVRAIAAATAPVPEPEPDRTRPFAVMIDNHPDALPQSGIAAASEVWEVLVEGGLTRLMAVYRGQTAEEIGPVRSSRPYFIELARGLDAVYAHVGGSDEALKRLADPKSGLDNADGITDGVTFVRDHGRSAPHNVYTSTGKMRALITGKDWRSETKAGQMPRSEAAPTGMPANDVVVAFGGGPTKTEFRYDGGDKAYRRLEAGRGGLDRDGAVEQPRTIVVIETDQVPIDDPHGKGLIGMRVTGGGQARVFRDGVEVDGTWQKAKDGDALSIADGAGTEISLAPGLVWYAVVAVNRGGGVRVTP